MREGRDIMEIEFRKYIGNRIKYYREKSGLTQEQLSKDIGVSIQQIQHYERGRNSINVPRLLTIATLLNVTIYDFLPTYLAGTSNLGSLLDEILENQRKIVIHTTKSIELTSYALKTQVKVGI